MSRIFDDQSKTVPTVARLTRLCLLAVVLPLIGCRVTQPTRADLAGALDKHESLLDHHVAGQPLLDFAQARTAVLLNGRDWELRELGRDVYLVKGGDESAGSAAILTRDGYLLTAAHCVSSGHVLAFVPGPDGFVPAGVRVVWVGDAGSSDTDFAVLRLQPLAPLPFDSPPRFSPAPTPFAAASSANGRASAPAGDLNLAAAVTSPDGPRFEIVPRLTAWFGQDAMSDEPPKGQTVLFVGMQPQPAPLGFQLFASAGRVRRVWRDAGDERLPLRQIEFDGPIRPGFSGGPAVDADGRILGIVHSLRVIRTGPRQIFRVRGLTPDPDWLALLIAADRSRRRSWN